MSRPVYELKAAFFKTLGHPVRIRVLQALREGERSVSELADAVGVGGSTLSQHLGVLRRAELITAERDGSTLRYRITDPRVFHVLEAARQILTSSLAGSQELLTDLQELDFQTPTRS